MSLKECSYVRRFREGFASLPFDGLICFDAGQARLLLRYGNYSFNSAETSGFCMFAVS